MESAGPALSIPFYLVIKQTSTVEYSEFPVVISQGLFSCYLIMLAVVEKPT